MEPLNYWELPEQWLTEEDDTDLPEVDPVAELEQEEDTIR